MTLETLSACLSRVLCRQIAAIPHKNIIFAVNKATPYGSQYLDMRLIEINIQRIIDLCRKHKVKSLAVFGSILTDRFDEESDVDLLVDFEQVDHDTFDYVGNYFDLRDGLERLLDRTVDLIEYGNNLNPIFKASIDKKKVMIYG